MEDAENYESSILISMTDCFIIHKYPLACLGDAYAGMTVWLALANETRAKVQSPIVCFSVSSLPSAVITSNVARKGLPWQLGSPRDDGCSRAEATLGCI